LEKEIKDTLRDHETRIRNLETDSAVLIEKIGNLCIRLDGLISWIKAFTVIGAGAIMGFLFWYIQSLD
jgi:predicted component of type VI protein secretion system